MKIGIAVKINMELYKRKLKNNYHLERTRYESYQRIQTLNQIQMQEMWKHCYCQKR